MAIGSHITDASVVIRLRTANDAGVAEISLADADTTALAAGRCTVSVPSRFCWRGRLTVLSTSTFQITDHGPKIVDVKPARRLVRPEVADTFARVGRLSRSPSGATRAVGKPVCRSFGRRTIWLGYGREAGSDHLWVNEIRKD